MGGPYVDVVVEGPLFQRLLARVSLQILTSLLCF